MRTGELPTQVWTKPTLMESVRRDEVREGVGMIIDNLLDASLFLIRQLIYFRN